MKKYSKAISVFITSAVGLAVAFGFVTEPESHLIVAAITSVVDVLIVYLVPNGEPIDA